MMTRGVGKSVKIIRSKIGKRIHFQVTPYLFDGIEFGSVGRQRECIEIRRLFQEGLHLPGAMRQESIPNQYDGCLDLPTEMSEKVDDQSTVDVYIGMEAKIEMEPVSIRCDAKSRDHRDFLMRASSLIKNRRLPPGSPTPSDQRRHEKATFIEKHEIRVSARGFF